MTKLEPYKMQYFSAKLVNGVRSKARRGYCSFCWKPRPAKYAVITEQGGKFALCEAHGRMHKMRKEILELRLLMKL